MQVYRDTFLICEAEPFWLVGQPATHEVTPGRRSLSLTVSRVRPPAGWAITRRGVVSLQPGRRSR